MTRFVTHAISTGATSNWCASVRGPIIGRGLVVCLGLSFAWLQGCTSGPPARPGPTAPAENEIKPSYTAPVQHQQAHGPLQLFGQFNEPPAVVMPRLMGRLKANPAYRRVRQSGPGEISLQFLPANPTQYVDCGVIEVPAPNGGVTRFSGASPRESYQAMLKGRAYGVERKLALQADATITVAARGATASGVSVSVRYGLTREQVATSAGDAPIRVRDQLIFTSKQGAAFARAPTKCVSSGVLESELLNLVK